MVYIVSLIFNFLSQINNKNTVLLLKNVFDNTRNSFTFCLVNDLTNLYINSFFFE